MINEKTDNKLSCKCGCGFKPAQTALQALSALNAQCKLKTGKSVAVTSAARCASHNKKVGGVQNSAHTKGLAFDIATPTSADRYYILNVLFALGVRRIGINFDKSFIHFDIDETLPNPVIFKY
jgi:uncharacterized protein YcbK (DUF882 family)